MSTAKYIVNHSGEVVVFAESIMHRKFRGFSPIGAGFIWFGRDDDGQPSCKCYGESESLGIQSRGSIDTYLAMRQIMDYKVFELNADGTLN